MNRKRAQLASTIERTLQQVLARGVNDPRVRGLITITSVELNDELKTAFVNVSILPEEHESLTMHGLRAATTHIRKQAMERIRTREMPRIEFRLDRSVKAQAELLGLINRAIDDTAPIEPDPDPDAEPHPQSRPEGDSEPADRTDRPDDAGHRAANDAPSNRERPQ